MSLIQEPGTPDAAVPGRTTIRPRAVQHLAAGLVRDTARVSARDISVTLSDDAGALTVSVVLPAVVSEPPLTIPEQSERLRAGLIAGLQDLAHRTVGCVDIRFSGVKNPTERRVV